MWYGELREPRQMCVCGVTNGISFPGSNNPSPQTWQLITSALQSESISFQALANEKKQAYSALMEWVENGLCR